MNVSKFPGALAHDGATFTDISSIERIIKQSFGASNVATEPCRDMAHQVSSIDLVGDTAAALVEFTDCTGSSYTDLYVLQKHNETWAIESKAWDSHAFN